MKSYHQKHFSGPKFVNCYSSLRNPNGKRTIFAITKNAQITEFTQVNEDNLILEYVIRGVAPSRSTPKTMSHNVHLSNLKMVNIYESFTEFLTTSGIDFMYVLQGGPSFEMLSNLNFIPPPSVVAQWSIQDEELDDQLEHLGKRVIRERELPPLELDFS